MTIPLRAAIEAYETMKEVRSLLKACLYHPDMHDPEGWLRQAIDLIDSIDASRPEKGGAVLKGEKE